MEVERRIGERLSELVQRQEKIINARLDEMLKAVTAIKDRLQGSGGATAMVDIESNRESLVEEDDPIVQLRSLKQVSHIRSYIEAFDELNSRAGIEEDQALSLFLSGLVDEIRVPVCLFTPRTLDEAYALSKLQELTLTGVFWCDREESNLRRNEKLDVNSKVEGLNYEFDESSEFADEMETDKEVSEGASSGSDEGGDGLVDFGNFFLDCDVDVKAGERLNHDKVQGTELGQYVVAFSDYKTCSQAKKLQGTERLAIAQRNTTLRELAATLSVNKGLKRLLLQIPKPKVKMKFMKTAMEDIAISGEEYGNFWRFSLQFNVDTKGEGSTNNEETHGASSGASGAEQILLTSAFSNNTYQSLTWLSVRFPKPMVKLKFMAQHDEEMDKEDNVQWVLAKAGKDQIYVVVLEVLGWLCDGEYDAYALSKLQELTMTGVLWCDHDTQTTFVRMGEWENDKYEMKSEIAKDSVDNLIVHWKTLPKLKDDLRELVELKEENEVFETCDLVDVSLFRLVKEDLNFCEREIGNSKSSSMHFDDVKESFDVNPARLVDNEETYYANCSASLAVKIMLILAFNSNNYLSLKWLSVLSTKPTVKMKLMNVPVDSYKVLKSGGMTRGTHMHTQHDEVIGGKLGKQFDLDVESAAMWQQRTIVHFGQRFGVDARAVERLDHGKVNGIEDVQYIVAFSYYRTCSQAKEFKETELLANAKRNTPSRELTAILSVIRNLKGFSVRFPKPMVKMKLELFSLWELLREADMWGVSRRKVVCQGAHAWGLEQGHQVNASKALPSSTNETMAVRDVLNSAIDEEIA